MLTTADNTIQYSGRFMTDLSAAPAPFDLPELAQSLLTLKGVGPVISQALTRRGFNTLGDALFLFPLRYEDRRTLTPLGELQSGQRAVVRGKILSSNSYGNKGKLWRLVLAEDNIKLICLWFHFKKAALEKYNPGDELIVVGTVEDKQPFTMLHPLLFEAVHNLQDHAQLGRLVPIYPEIEGVGQARIQRIIQNLMDNVGERLPDPLWQVLPRDFYPYSVGQAIKQAHYPESDLSCNSDDICVWRKSLAVNELFYYELGLALKRKQWAVKTSEPFLVSGGLQRAFLEALPYSLTSDQAKVLQEINNDLQQTKPMGRLVAGDVSTGKTVLAMAAACVAAEAGLQTAILAPTEVLARQHYAVMEKHLRPLGLQIALATGSQQGVERALSREQAVAAPLVIGTHALLAGQVKFSKLGLIIIDEQHRFGVHQRLNFAAKGLSPHMLVLSATPIPRTLALALAGHLDISRLYQKPYDRPPVETKVLAYGERALALDMIAQTLRRGEQVYVICPLVEESDKIDAHNAVVTHRNLSRHFKDFPVGLLHGRLGADQQQQILDQFRCGAIPLLVATTVVEVGVDVPEATLMVVLTAERFGLSQLHQLRGRVGRGAKPGKCVLVAGAEPGDMGRQRLEVLGQTQDGLEVAEADLYMRGPGQALGIKQSGLPPFRVARWPQDTDLILPIRAIIEQQLASDAGLQASGWPEIHRETLRRWGRRLGLLEAG